jgi:hypothetical protein
MKDLKTVYEAVSKKKLLGLDMVIIVLLVELIYKKRKKKLEEIRKNK